MRKNKLLLILILICNLQIKEINSATANGTASIVLSAPLAISNTTNLNFGTSGIKAVAGAVISMASNGTVTCTASACGGAIAGNANGVMAISGGTDGLLAIAFSSSTINLTGTNDLALLKDNTSVSACEAYAPDSGCSFNIYGAVTLPNPITANTYTGTYTVTVSQ